MGTFDAISLMTRLSWTRLMRGRTKWITLILAAMPIAVAIAAVAASSDARAAWASGATLMLQFCVPLAMAIHLAPTVGDELEGKTYTYLWSRPLPRASLLYGRLLATAPLVIGAFAAATLLLFLLSRGAGAEEGGPPVHLGRTLGAVVLAAFSVGALSLFFSAMLPKFTLGAVLTYLLLGDKLLALVPSSAVRELSMSYHAQVVAGLVPNKLLTETPERAAAAMVVLGALLLWLAANRLKGAEYKLLDG